MAAKKMTPEEEARFAEFSKKLWDERYAEWIVAQAAFEARRAEKEALEDEADMELFECPTCDASGIGDGPKGRCNRCKGNKYITENE